MLLALGDLVEDIAVELPGPINLATDTAATILRRRGGSAANVAVAVAELGSPARFVGQVGDDAIGEALTAEMERVGVDVSFVRRRGTTGTIVALVDSSGERSMLTDRRACTDLDRPDPTWLDGVTTVHVPLYSFAEGATATTATTIVGWAHERSIAVSVDLSSVTVLESLGHSRVVELLAALDPDVVFANADEARVFGVAGAVGRSTTIVKRGAAAAIAHLPGRQPVEVEPLGRFPGADTTGAGDAFAAGFLVGPWRDDAVEATAAGHRCAARLLAARLATVGR